VKGRTITTMHGKPGRMDRDDLNDPPEYGQAHLDQIRAKLEAGQSLTADETAIALDAIPSDSPIRQVPE